MMKRCQTARTMAKSKALDCAVQCCSSLVSWAVGDAKFFGNEKPNGPATCYWPAIAHLSSLFASISNWKFVWKFNQIQILATWGGGGHSWNGLTTDKRTVEHAYNGGREMAQLFRCWAHTNGPPPPPPPSYSVLPISKWRRWVGRPVATFSHLQFSFFRHRLLFLLPPLLSRTRQVQIRNDGTNIFG
jgi:hypothetical protein